MFFTVLCGHFVVFLAFIYYYNFVARLFGDYCASDLAGGPGGGRGDGHPQVSVGVSLLDDIVGDGAAPVIQRWIPGDDHVVSVDFVEYHGALRWLWAV